MSITKEFTDFIAKGDVIDLAVAVVIGVAFNAVVTAFVSDIITPLIGVAGKVNFASITYTINGSTFLLGSFLNALISFMTIALVIFLFVVKPISKMNAMHKAEPAAAPQTKECKYCLSTIPKDATRCAFCTSRLPAA
jgi:large conductance mechanosensitive channel